jgi:segregation and condensation protein B
MATEAQRAIEAILMVADTPVEPGLLAQLLEVSPGTVEDLCADLATSYVDADRGFVLVRVAGGYRFQSHPDLAAYVERFVLEGQTARLSAAALETLAIVAYKQPVSRAQIAAIRGVNADGVLRTLEQRGYVAEVGRDPGPGQAVLYGTTSILLERLGLDGLADLPPLADFVPGPEIMEALEDTLRFGAASTRDPAGPADVNVTPAAPFPPGTAPPGTTPPGTTTAEAASQEAASQETAPQDTAAQDTASEETAPQETAPPDTGGAEDDGATIAGVTVDLTVDGGPAHDLDREDGGW